METLLDSLRGCLFLPLLGDDVGLPYGENGHVGFFVSITLFDCTNVCKEKKYNFKNSVIKIIVKFYGLYKIQIKLLFRYQLKLGKNMCK